MCMYEPLSVSIKAVDSLELELQMAVSLHASSRNQSLVLEKAMFLTAELSLLSP